MYKSLLGIDVSEEFAEVVSFDCIRCGDCDLCYFSPAVSGSEHFYKMLQAFNWYYMDEKNEYDFARHLVKPTDDILEIGCGKGAFAKLINCKSFLGLEYSKEAQILASENGVKVISETIQNHSTHKAQVYDVVCSFQVLEHVTDVRSFIESAVVCLKNNGLLIVSTPSSDSFAALVPNFILDMPPHHVTRWSDNSLINAAKLFNLDLLELWHEPLQDIHRGFYAQTICAHAVMELFRQQNRVWNDSFIYRFVSMACLIPSKLFAKCLPGRFSHPRGISVTAVFRKQAGE
ncbi:MAG: hypothetical protein A2076_12765 [Geobacteraceae bacterium GWC2_53_11]|nr:MAG: hypothetical protein A2076_12765 [Geobacteraceae bacterium GWC2_53_11]